MDTILEDRPKSHSTFMTSRLLGLPLELRDEIYSYLFSSTRLTYGVRLVGKEHACCVKPAPNALAILRVCRQIHYEVKSIWAAKVLFSFERAQDMLAKLYEIPPNKLAEIRHIRVFDIHFGFYSVGNKDAQYGFWLDWVLDMAPILHLETLTVIAPHNGSRAMKSLKALIKNSRGWKNLHFITRNSLMYDHSTESRVLDSIRLSLLKEIMNDRDGIESGGSITLHYSLKQKEEFAILNAENRQQVIQTISYPDVAPSSFLPDSDLSPFEYKRDLELLITVKRGSNVNYEERARNISGQDDIQRWQQGFDLKKVRNGFTGDIRGRLVLFLKENIGEVFDDYQDINELDWGF